MTRVPLLSGTRLAVIDVPEGGVVLRPPPPGEPIADVGAAVRDALRFPLEGDPLEALATRGGRATIVVEPPALPLPGAAVDPRQDAIAATVGELVRAGVPMERQTILVAAGLARRPGHRQLEDLVSPEFARRFHGRVEIHDAEDPSLLALAEAGGVHVRVAPALVEADVVVTVTAAESVLHGGPAVLLAAADARAVRAAEAASLVETASSPGWHLAVSIERALASRVPVMGVSLTLNLPRLGGALRGYPYEHDATERISRSTLRRT